MEKIKLTKREYLGEGYCYHFYNSVTKETENVQISKEAYEALGLPNGSLLNPISTDVRKYIGSSGGFPLLNTLDGVGRENDCYQLNDKWYVYEMTEPYPGIRGIGIIEYSIEEFNKKYTWQ